MPDPTETASPPGAEPGCPRGVEPADVGAWALDDEPHREIDLSTHVPGCPACQRALDAVAPARGAGAAVREHTSPGAGLQAGERALGRIRVEAGALLLLRTVAGAGGRLARAVPDYLTESRRKR